MIQRRKMRLNGVWRRQKLLKEDILFIFLLIFKNFVPNLTDFLIKKTNNLKEKLSMMTTRIFFEISCILEFKTIFYKTNTFLF